jgi:anaerobic magnesium-protoporphyrin IX monomethyl ester cyclase
MQIIKIALISGITMKVLLSYVKTKGQAKGFSEYAIPSEIISLAAYLEKDNTVTIINKNGYTLSRMERRLGEIDPQLVYLHIYTHNRIESLKFVKDLKKITDALIVVGGPFVTFLSMEIADRYPEIDFILRGEPELILTKIINTLSKKGKSDELDRILQFERITKPNSIPSVYEYNGRFINININEQFKYILTSRGSQVDDNLIPYSGYSGNELRPRSVRKTVTEIVNLQKKYGMLYFIIRDDDFLSDHERVLSFCRELARRRMYIMWQCSAHVNSVSEDLLQEMKYNGLERIRFNIFSGSPAILKEFSPEITQDKIRHATTIARKVGLYVSVRLFTGFPGETYSDIRKTQSLLQKIKPSFCEIDHLKYYPGTELYNQSVADKKIQPSIWFRSTLPEIFVRTDPEVESWIDELAYIASTLRYSSWYQTSDFKKHRRINLKGTWVTDVLEGDYYFDEEHYDLSDRIYRRVITAYPGNAWGYLRMGKVKFMVGSFSSSEQYFRTVSDLVPEYYGAYLKIAQSLIAQNKIKEARRVIDEAVRRNKYDPRIQNVRDALKWI